MAAKFMRLFILILLLFFSKSMISAQLSEEQWVKRIQAHRTLEDFLVARENIELALSYYPESASLYEESIRVLASLGDEKGMLQRWETYTAMFPNRNENRELIEAMAWGVLNKASTSSSLIMRQMALLAAYFSHEGNGVSIIHQGMRDSNYAIRAVAVKMAGSFRDDKLVEEVKYLFKSEKVWDVRKRILEAIGSMKIASLRSDLEALIASNTSHPSEKALAIAALLNLLDSVNRPEVEKLVTSNRAGLRLLACKAIAYFLSTADLDLLLRLGMDSQSEVRQAAFQAIGQIRPLATEELLSVIRKGTQDLNVPSALSAAWVLTLYYPSEGQQVFKKYLEDERREVCLLAAAALGSAGSYGLPLMLDQFRSHTDSFVKLNLSMGLIGQRIAVQESATYIRHMLMTNKEKWNKQKVGVFHLISNKVSKLTEDPLTTSESENQLIRLELLNVLSMLKDPQAMEAVRNYLLERSWGISATAITLLLLEGDESAKILVEQLLQDPQPRIRLQAALVLSMWGREESAIQALEDGYSTKDWELKSKILEGLGRIGSMHSIPFLIAALKESSQTLRLIAGMALIQCLNH